jgi:glycosyltransferase involved in cell wall biosynthesis
MVGWNEGDFYALFVGVNNNLPSRKGIFELLAGWQTFKQSVTTPAHLYLHTSPIGAGQFTGVHIPAACQLLGIGDSVVMTAEQDYLTGFKEAYLSALYAAADVLVLPSRGEGFGLPLIEAQAVGTPVITTDFAAGAELVGAGWKIEGEPEWSNQNALVMKAGIKSLADALQQAYQHRDNPMLRDSAVNFAKPYDIDEVCNRYLAPVMARIADSVLGIGV